MGNCQSKQRKAKKMERKELNLMDIPDQPFGWSGTLEHPPMWEVSYQKRKEKEAEEEEKEIVTDKEEEEEEERKMEEKGATGEKEEDEDQEMDEDKLSKVMEECEVYNKMERKRKREEKEEKNEEKRKNIRKMKLKLQLASYRKLKKIVDRDIELLKLLQICQVLDKLKQI